MSHFKDNKMKWLCHRNQDYKTMKASKTGKWTIKVSEEDFDYLYEEILPYSDEKEFNIIYSEDTDENDMVIVLIEIIYEGFEDAVEVIKKINELHSLEKKFYYFKDVNNLKQGKKYTYFHEVK